MRHLLQRACASMLALPILTYALSTSSAATPSRDEPIPPLYRQLEPKVHLPWSEIAAVDRYETTVHTRKQKMGIPKIPLPLWSGSGNPLPSDFNPDWIRVWQGVGRDADEDGIADPENHSDALYSLLMLLVSQGTDRNSFRRGLWDWYEDTRVVERISKFADIFQSYGRTNLRTTVFPLPKRASYSYRETWGDKRGWGGRRMHEGTDLFASYGTPVLSCTYGFVESKGWNKYGGWRIGIRGINNVYYYYAHLSRFEKGLQVGSIVKPGQKVGYVGSSGYGKPGTSGKFPPHLHFGMYRDVGYAEWAFDPYPYLRRWQRDS